MLVLLFAGVAAGWIWYGALRGDWTIIISNSISVLINIVIVVLTISEVNEKKV